MENKAKLIYDSHCTLCKMFAAFVAKSFGPSLAMQSWQDFRVTDQAATFLSDAERSLAVATSLHLITADRMLRDVDVWRWMLEHQPELKTLGWLAQKLNLETPTAKALHSTGQLLRRACLWCKPW